MYATAAALVIGITLGLMGSGGSILTVPVLVYLLGHDSKAAIAESLAIVGTIALVAMIPYARARLVSWHDVLCFGVPGMVGTYGGAWLAHYVPGAAQLVLFAVVMLLAAWLMLRPPKNFLKPPDEVAPDAAPPNRMHAKLAAEGFAVGVLTGLVGVGGGFLIVPALVLLARLPMRIAVGTSLVLITLNSFTGFLKYQDVLATLDARVDWAVVALFIAVGSIGSLVGKQLATRIPQTALRQVFAVFLLVMGLLVLGKETPSVWAEFRGVSQRERAHNPHISLSFAPSRTDRPQTPPSMLDTHVLGGKNCVGLPLPDFPRQHASQLTDSPGGHK